MKSLKFLCLTVCSSLLLTSVGAFADDGMSSDARRAEQDLQQKLDEALSVCSGIKKDLDSIFGLSVATTVVSGTGTLASGGALGVGVAKIVTDNKTEKLENQVEMYQLQSVKITGNSSISLNAQPVVSGSEEEVRAKVIDVMGDINTKVADLQKQIAENEKKSSILGNVRTGLMAGATATSVASTVTSAVAGSQATKLAKQMEDCDKKIHEVKLAKGVLEAYDEISNSSALEKAKNVLNVCVGFDKNNINTLKTTMTASAVVSGIGSATAGAGTVTSVLANSKKVRNDNSVEGKKKEKGLNLASNILAGVATGTSGASTVLSATAIEKAKKDSVVAENCENALK